MFCLFFFISYYFHMWDTQLGIAQFRRGSLESRHFYEHFLTTLHWKASQGKILELFLLDGWNCISNEVFNPWTQSGYFFLKIKVFLDFRKRAGKALPPHCPLSVHQILKHKTVFQAIWRTINLIAHVLWMASSIFLAKAILSKLCNHCYI